MRSRNHNLSKRFRKRFLLVQFILAAGASTAMADGLTYSNPCPPLVNTEVIECCPPVQNLSPSQPFGSSVQQPSSSAAAQQPAGSSPSANDSFLNDATTPNGNVDFSNSELNSIADNLSTQPSASSFASTSGSRGGLNAPNMLGDFFGGTFLYSSVLGGVVALAGGDRRFKIAENTSPIPTDRVFVNYNHFEDALGDANGARQDLDRFTLGFEKTFWSKQASFELRLPIADGLNSTQVLGATDTTNTELGNLAMALKFALLADSNSLLSAGVTATVPTGDDYVRQIGPNSQRIENEAVHLAPFLGYVSTPTQNWFFQSYIQADFDLNGNAVSNNLTGFDGVLQDQNLLFVDASLGRWIRRRQDRCGNVFGAAVIGELHYTTTVNDPDNVAGFTNDFNRVDILNASVGLHLQRGLSSLRIGAGAPLRNNEESLFDSEILVQFNRVF